MDIKEKLRQASQEAERLALEAVPEDEEIFWEPSEDFNRKMNCVIASVGENKPASTRFFFRRIAISAAVVLLLGTLIFLPLSQGDFDTADNSGSCGFEENDHSLRVPIDDSDRDQSEIINSHESDGFTDDISTSDNIYDSKPPYSPSYIPDGYELVNITDDDYIMVLEYSDGKNSFSLQCLSDCFDFTQLGEGFEVIYHNSNSYYNRIPPLSDPDPIDGADWNSNNVAWTYGGNTFILIGNSELSHEEVQKIALSVNLIPNEQE